MGAEDDGVRDAVDDVMRGGLLAELGTKRDELVGQLGDLVARAGASRQALANLLAKRLRILGEGGDAVQLRGQLATARQDLDDWETAAGLVQQQIGTVDQRIAEVLAEQQLAEMRALLAPAVAERDAAVRATGGRMAAAVLAVKAAAEEFAAALTDETAARDRAELLAAQVASLAGSLGEPEPNLPDEPESTILPVRGGVDVGGPELALRQAIQAAASGWSVKVVAGHLAEADGWVPPTRAEQAATEELMRQRHAETDRLMRQSMPGMASQPWTNRTPEEFGVDEHGNPVGWMGYRPPLGGHPQDVWLGLGGR